MGRPKKTDKKLDKKQSSKSDLKKRIDAVCAAVAKTCPSEWSGDDPIMTLRGDKISKIPTFSTGSLELDRNMGGGFAWGRIAEIYGPESAGKSTLVLHVIANVQNLKGNDLCALIDSENSFDPIYAQNLNVDVENLLVSQPDSGEHALNVMMELIRNDVRLVVVDSVAALTPRDMFENAAGVPTMGKHAKMMSEGLRNLNTLLMKKRASVIFTNQIRTQIGVAYASMAGSTTGGNALRFYASQRVELKRIGSDKRGEEIINNIVKAKVAKNKIAPPFRVCNFKIRFGKGIDLIDQIIDISIDNGLIEKSGTWFTVDENRCQGKEKVYELLENNTELKNKLHQKVKDIINGDDITTPDEGIPIDKTTSTDIPEDSSVDVDEV